MKTPYEYQKKMIRLMSEKNFINGDECGMGKTLCTVETIKELRSRKEPFYQRPILILARKRAIPFWVEELRDQGINDEIIVLGVSGRGLPQEVSGSAIVLTHHESLIKIVSRLRSIDWTMIVIDEIHAFKNRKSKRFAALKLLRAYRRIGLTGTLMEKSSADVWALLNWIDTENFRSYWKFKEEFVLTQKNFYGYEEIIGIRNPEKFSELLIPYYLRRTKKEVRKDLPERIENVIEVPLLPKQKELYKTIAKADDILLQIQDKELVILNALSRIVKLQQVVSDPRNLNFEIPSAKVEWIKEFIEDNPDEPLVIFTKFRSTAVGLAGILDSDLIIGGSNSFGTDFISGRKNILVGTIAAMSESLNLQRASTAIFLDQEWSRTKMVQAVDRIYRINITEPKYIIYLISPHTVDNLVWKALDQKWSQIRMVEEFLAATKT